MKKRNVGILIFNDAEVLDFSGPFEVFSVASEINENSLFNVFTIGQTLSPIISINGMSVNPKYSIENSPEIDLLIIAGGSGTRKLIEEEETMIWVNNIHKNTEFTLSICSGSRVLGKLGLLDNKKFCTHRGVYDHMKEIAPLSVPQEHLRFVNDGKIYTSGGISAGIDLSFHVLEKICGKSVATATAEYMEYNVLTNY